MRVKEITKIVGGEVLGAPVYSKDNDILIPKGAVLKIEYVELLKSLNISYIQIEDMYRPYEKAEFFISIEQKVEYVDKVKIILEKHIYNGKNSLKNLEVLAADIVDEIWRKSIDHIYDMRERKGDLYEHTIAVTILSLMTARKLSLPKESFYNIAMGCLLHDLGLRYIMTSYVNQSFEAASAADFFEYKKHTILAYTVLEKENWISKISKNMILSHHEKLDGTGFPLKQKNQGIECKIIQVCDKFDCLISGMECKRDTVVNTVEYLLSQSGKTYDMDVVNALLSFTAMYPVGTEVKLTDGKYGIVSSQSKNSKRPEIVLLDQKDGKVKADEICNLEKESSILIEKVIQ